MSKKPNDSDVAFVSALAELLRDHDLSELEVTRDFAEDDSITVRVARHASVAPTVQHVAAPATPAAPSPASATDAPAAPATPDTPPAAEEAGKVKRILVDDGAPVEFGAPLVILE